MSTALKRLVEDTRKKIQAERKKDGETAVQREKIRLPYKPAHFTVKQIKAAVAAAGKEEKRAVTAVEQEKFNFCVGRPWSDPAGSVCVYAYGREVQYGTMEDARGYREYVEQQTGEKSFIYLLVRVPDNR